MSSVNGSPADTDENWATAALTFGRRCGAGILALLGIAETVGGVGALVAGNALPGLLLLAAGAYMLHIFGLGASLWGWPRRAAPPCTDATGSGLVFAYSYLQYYWLTSTIAPAVLVTLGFGGLAVATLRPVEGAVGVVLIALALLSTWFLVTVLRRAPGRIALSVKGVQHRGLTFEQFVPWHAILGVVGVHLSGTPSVVVRASPGPDTQVRRYTGRFTTTEGQFLPFVAVRSSWLAGDPEALYRALTFYLENPSLRSELSSDAALRRILGESDRR